MESTGGTTAKSEQTMDKNFTIPKDHYKYFPSIQE